VKNYFFVVNLLEFHSKIRYNMNNFIFHNPTKLIFGKGTISSLSNEIPKDKTILVTFGGGSVKSNGVYNQVKKLLKGSNTMNSGVSNQIRP
jgi:alcohol dehydrogenase YqhD (iron-dependent ADH family)